MSHSFTPPTGPNGGMSRDGHAFATDTKDIVVVLVVIAAIIGLIAMSGKN